MADENIITESSPVEETAVVETPVVEYTPIKELAAYTPEERERWEKTGELAEEQVEPTKDQEAAPDKSASNVDGKTPVPETGKDKAPKKAKTAEDRKAELAAEIQELLKKRKELREEVAPKPTAEAPKTEDKKAATSTEATDGRPVKPKLQDFVDAGKSYEEYEDARDKYNEELIDWKADQKAEAKLKAFKEDNQKEQQQTSRRSKWEKSIEESKKDRPDYELVALNPELQLSAPMLEFLEESELRGDLLYALGEDLDNAKRIAGLSPVQVARELVKLESSLSTPEPETAVSTPKPVVSKTPAPARRLNGPPGAPDLEAAALAKGDVTEYMRLANAREMAEKTGRR
jgi:hypothetical protein